MAKYNTFKYGDGTLYTDPLKVVLRYGVVADPTPTVSGLSFQQLFRISVRITQSAGVFVISNIRPTVGDGGYYPHTYDCSADEQNIKRVSVRIKHSNGTLFEINQIRPIVEKLVQEPIG